MSLLAILGVVIAAAIVVPRLSRTWTTRAPQASASASSVDHGSRVVLPAALTASSPVRGVVVTPYQAREVVQALWGLREQARATRNTTVISQIETGSARFGDTFTCACSKARPLIELQVLVPRQARFPAQFLAHVATTRTGMTSWAEIMIFTRASQSAPWQLAFDTGAGSTSDEQVSLITPSTDQSGYVSRPDPHLHATARELPGRLAAYWQRAKDTGDVQPAQNAGFLPGAWTSERAQTVAKYRQGAVNSNNLIGHMTYIASNTDPMFEYLVDGGDMACSTVREVVTWVGVGDRVPWQTADRKNWGDSLPPGRYSSITENRQWQTCFFIPAGGAAPYRVLGGNGHLEDEVTGTPVT